MVPTSKTRGKQTERSNDAMSPLTMLWMIKTEVLEVYNESLGCSAQKVYKVGV